MLTEFHIGIDDTDSRLGGCTTYTAALLFQELVHRGFEPIDYPWLIRLNPNIPWKTRGNGALSLHLKTDEDRIDEVKQLAIQTVEKTSDLLQPSTDPAIVFLQGPVSDQLREFSTKALHYVQTVKEARQLACAVGIEILLLKGSRGIVGALASLGADLEGDHTFEILAYRQKDRLGTPRKVNLDSVRRMDAMFHGLTFNNIDPETDRVLICPHGPDPVLLGIRGEDPESVTRAFAKVETDESVERTQIFKSNQGTDAHLTFHSPVSELRPHQSATIKGTVNSNPQLVRGGHVIFEVRDDSGSIDCAAYQKTGFLREAALSLLQGDLVLVSGGIRTRHSKQLTLNIEKLTVKKLVESITYENPRCSACRASCESMGRGQGFRCRKCKARLPRTDGIKKINPRSISLGVYLPPARAHRHLTKPSSRYRLAAPIASAGSSLQLETTLGLTH